MSIELNAEMRDVKGKGASRRLRHAKKVPAILYGHGQDPVSIQLEQKDVQYVLPDEAFYSQVLVLNLAGNKEDVLLRDLQHHPFRQDILHMDFQRVDAKKVAHVHVPIHFTGEDESPGIKTEGGAVSHVIMEVEVACLPRDIPAFLEVDLSEMHVGDVIHLTDIKLPAGVEILALSHGEVHEHDTAVASMHVRKVAAEPEEEGEVEAPEVSKDEGDEAED